MNMEKISTEAIQQFTSAQAWEYRLVPYALENGVLKCYGETGRDYGGAIQEIEVIHGLRADIARVKEHELSKTLRQYYRQEKPSSPDVREEVGTPGFLSKLIEEAFDTGASD